MRPGLRATVQDGGRVGHGHLGVPRAGAMDGLALAQANRLVGNPSMASAIEFMLGGLTIRFQRSAAFALTGAPVAASLGRRPVPLNTWVYARPGEVLSTGRTCYGLWSYLAVAGGIEVPTVLASRSTDTLSGLGPPPIAAGDVLLVGDRRGSPHTPADVFTTNATPARRIELRFRWGPRDDWFSSESRRVFVSATWTVSSDVDRIAARLTGPALVHSRKDQLPTEGVHLGSVQVPPSGQPLVFLANHPPTGGYPIIGVLHEDDVGRMAQAAPGTQVVLRPVAAARSSSGPPGAPRGPKQLLGERL
jgi:biotin-dependent carboxylase-like uncharacterized protein